MSAVIGPSATLAGYQLIDYTITASIDSILKVIEYSFSRNILWTTIVEKFADAGFETSPQQTAAGFEFTLNRTNAPKTEIDLLETFLDAQNGAARPFHFTAPDDGEVYEVTFKTDQIQYTASAADTKSYVLSLVTTLVSNAEFTLSLSNTSLVAATLSVTASFSQGFSGVGLANVNAIFGPIFVNTVIFPLGGGLTPGATSFPKTTFTKNIPTNQLPSIGSLSIVGAITGTLFEGDVNQQTNPPTTASAVLTVYEIFITALYTDNSTRIVRPRLYTQQSGPGGAGALQTGISGIVVAPWLAIDGDPNTSTTITRTYYGPLMTPGYVQWNRWIF